MVILTLLPSAALGGPRGLAVETVNIQNVRVKVSAQLYNHVHPCITLRALLLPVPSLIADNECNNIKKQLPRCNAFEINGEPWKFIEQILTLS